MFNHEQSQALLKYGKIDSRARTYMGGNAYANGTAYAKKGQALRPGGSVGGVNFTKNKNFYSNGNNAGKSQAPSYQKTGNYTPRAAKAADQFKEKLDWIEILIDRIQRNIDKLDKVAGSAFTTLASRVTASEDQFKALNNEIEKSREGAQRYLKEANSVGLSEEWAKKVRDGAIDISTITDKALYEAIQEYQQWYEKYLDLYYKEIDLTEEMGTTLQERFNSIADNFESQIDRFNHISTMLDTQLNIISNQGKFAGFKIYNALIDEEEKKIKKLSDKYYKLKKEREDSLATKVIEEGSEADYEMLQIIEETQEAWAEAKNQMLEYKNAALEMRNEIFEYGMKQMDDLRAESEFIQDLLSLNESDLFVKETGRFTDQGDTVNALHAMNYAVAMAEADEYARYIEKINEDLAKDPNNTKLLDFKQQYIEAQREAIQNANAEKTAIRDLVSDSYERMKKVLSELIEKRKEYLQAEKDIYDYQNRVEEQTKNISSLRKQYLSLQNDTSEEAKARRQKVSDQLKDAEKELEQTEYERYISDQEKLMDDTYTEFEEFLTERLDHLEEFLQQYIDYSNQNTDKVYQQISDATDAVGYTLSQRMESIWGTSGSWSTQFTNYEKGFLDKFTTLNTAIDGIWTILKDKFVTKTPQTNPVTVDKPGATPKPGTSTNTTNTNKPTTNNTNQNKPASQSNSNQNKTVKVGTKVRVSPNTPIFWDSYGTVGPYGSRQYFANDPVYYVMGESNGYWLLRHHSQSSAAGWFRKGDVAAMKTGGYTGSHEGMAILHKKERVLNADQTKAFERLIYDILPNFGELANSLKNASNISNMTSSGDMNITFNLPNVKDTNDFIREIQNNKSFEDWMRSATVDLIAGKHSLRKYNKKI